MEIPQDIRWLFAVAGLVLLAAAILGGGLQIREIAIPRISKIQRLLAGVAGIVFVALALIPTHEGKPRIESFQVNPSRIDVGESSELSWHVSGAAKVTIEPDVGDVAVASGHMRVSPKVSTVFTLTAINGESVNARADVQVGTSPPREQAKPTITSFQASPDRIDAGQQTTLRWTVSEAFSVVIDPQIGSVALSGQRTISPDETTTYVLTATSQVGSSTATTLVNVGAPPQRAGSRPVVSSFRANPPSIDAGGHFRLIWEVSDATSVTISPVLGDVAATGQQTVSPTETTTYTLVAKNTNGRTSKTAIVQVRTATTPELALRGTESYDVRGREFIRYDLTVQNWDSFSADLFRSAPDLPPCGRNTSSSRTWVNIHDVTNDRYIYGFCGLSSPEGLRSIWFAVERGMTPPRAVYVLLHDRKEGSKYRSNNVQIQ